MPRRIARKVLVLVRPLLGLTLVFESRDYSPALIKTVIVFFEGVTNQF